MLAKLLTKFVRRPEVLVLALPRGGVPVGFEVAQALSVPLDVFVVRKLGLPGIEEVAMGAIASGDVRVLNSRIISSQRVPPPLIHAAVERERRELRRREVVYRADRPFPQVRDRTVILVDDGIATGSTMRAAISALRRLQAAPLVVATPTVAWSTAEELQREVEEFYAVVTPLDFVGVGQWYEDFSQTSDHEVRALLEESATFTNQARSTRPRDKE